MKRIILFLFLLQSIALYGQPELNRLYNQYLDAKRRDMAYFNHISGSPYANADFAEAKVYVREKQEPLISKLRYNNYFDEMEILQNNEEEYLILKNKADVDSILLNGMRYQYMTYSYEDESGTGFFIHLKESDPGPKLFLKRPKEFQEEKPPESGYDQYKPAAFLDKNEEFYVQFDDDPLILIPNRRKKIEELFSEKGFESKMDSKVRYNRESLKEFFSLLKKTD